MEYSKKWGDTRFPSQLKAIFDARDFIGMRLGTEIGWHLNYASFEAQSEIGLFVWNGNLREMHEQFRENRLSLETVFRRASVGARYE
jgi:hypothetical protein